jgi:hypothetical protein
MDPKQYAAAKARFAAITKDVKVVARYQVALLDRAMCERRMFDAKGFRERFIEHPLVRHLGKRVVWTQAGTSFRLADDGTLADVHDATFALRAGEGITVAHPVTMSETERTAWRTRFADYRIMQPFPQLARELYVALPTEIGEHDIARAVGTKTTRGRLFQLGRRGWRLHQGFELERQLPCDAIARFQVSPPVVDGGADDQVFTITSATCTYALDRLPPIDYSELVRDLEYAHAG